MPNVLTTTTTTTTTTAVSFHQAKINTHSWSHQLALPYWRHPSCTCCIMPCISFYPCVSFSLFVCYNDWKRTEIKQPQMWACKLQHFRVQRNKLIYPLVLLLYFHFSSSSLHVTLTDWAGLWPCKWPQRDESGELNTTESREREREREREARNNRLACRVTTAALKSVKHFVLPWAGFSSNYDCDYSYHSSWLQLHQ